MNKFQLKGIGILAVVILGVLFTLPTFVKMPDVKWLPQKAVKLGLDLQGGMHLVLQVDTNKAIENRMNNTSAGLKDQLMKSGVALADEVEKTIRCQRARHLTAISLSRLEKLGLYATPNLGQN